MKPILPAVAVATALVLAGCGTLTLGPTPTPTATPTQAASPSATPTPTPTPTRTPPPQFEGEVLFSIAAKITATDGATANLKQTVYAPVSDLGELDDVQSLLTENCSAGEADSYLVSEITATDSSRDGDEWDAEPQFKVTMAGTSVFLGDIEQAHAFCTNVQGYVPGEILAVSTLMDGAVADDAGGWATFAYGFGVTDESVTLSQCRVIVSEKAKQLSALVDMWPGVRQDPGHCEVNTLGL